MLVDMLGKKREKDPCYDSESMPRRKNQPGS